MNLLSSLSRVRQVEIVVEDLWRVWFSAASGVARRVQASYSVLVARYHLFQLSEESQGGSARGKKQNRKVEKKSHSALMLVNAQSASSAFTFAPVAPSLFIYYTRRKFASFFVDSLVKKPNTRSTSTQNTPKNTDSPS